MNANLDSELWPILERETFDYFFSVAKKYGIEWTAPAAIYFIESTLQHMEKPERERLTRALLMMIEDLPKE